MKINAISAFVNKGLFIAAIAMLFFASACKNKNAPKRPPETMLSGTINISVDESFKPVIDSQIRVFESLNAGRSHHSKL